VIIKRAMAAGHDTYDPDASSPGPAWRLFNDWAGLQFLSQLADGPPPSPRFYAGDRTQGLIVVEDLGTGLRLDHLLLSKDAGAAETALTQLGTTLGQMHALTAGNEAAFDRLRDGLGPRAQRTAQEEEGLRAAFRGIAEALGVRPSSAVDRELAALQTAIQGASPFRTYIHGDPCPDNCLYAGATLRLLDFEFGAFGHALLDGVYGRVPFPTCWCTNRIPERIAGHMEEAYRTELVKGCAAAADDHLFYRAVVEACAWWALKPCQWAPLPTWLEQDSDWGIATLRQRVLGRFTLLARLTEDFGHLEALGAVAGALAVKLRDIWPLEADAMPTYPAFQ
jgi:tRNA A-37 threonylcarbamoyl transferase component Bud32